jgi:hypothetical protein
MPMGVLRICEHGHASSKCGVCEPERSRQRARAGAEAYRERFLMRRYGITGSDYEGMLEGQNGVCAICGRPETRRTKGGKVGRRAVDHDHVTGRVRGLLCHRCNAGIAYLSEDPERLRIAAVYLEAP